MTRSKFSVEKRNEIKRIMKQDRVSRKTAIRRIAGKKAAVPAAKTKKTQAAAKKLAPAQVSKARAAGVKLFVAAGRPTATQFVKVFGKDGVRMTWQERAAFVGLASAEEAAAKFQSMLTKQGR